MAGATPLGNMVIKLGLDDADFGKGVANSKKQVQYLAKEMQANMKVADLAGNKLGKLGTRYDSLTQIIKAQENQVSALKKAYDGSFVDGKATDSTKRLANQLQDANGKLANYKLQLQNTAGAIADYQIRNEGLTGSINKASDVLITNGKRLGELGSSLTKSLTVPIVAGVTAVTAAAISWESAFAGVKKTSDEVVDSNGNVVYSYDDLEASLRNLANELPSTHSEIAAVAEAAGQLGIQTENVSAFTKVMIDLGESTNMSAETAATELARFANITQMSQDKFSNLGSALVDLGNNFATTESEISAMSLRLAGAGAQIGMSEGEILGFAAALSSVGVEAEAGGSAFSKVMINMQLAVEKGTGAFDELKAHADDQGVSWERLVSAVRNGGKELTGVSKEMGFTSAELKKMYKEADNSKTSLEQFADVAGMTGDKFAEMFKSNPSEAIMKFVEGLGKAEEKGTSAISVLDEMGITEVRLRDSLLRAANASGVFAGAVEMGNKAFGENTALAEEAGKRYETTESKLKMLRNEAVNTAIDLGGPFVDALRAGLESSKPLVEQIGKLATAFSEADPKTQQMIVKLLAATAAAGPLLSITGKLSGGIGNLGKSFIDLSASMAKKKAIDEVKKSFNDGDISANDFLKTLSGGSGTMTQFGAAASGAAGSGGIGAMSAALGPLGPLILGIVGVGGALAVGYGAWKLFGEEAWNSSQRVQRWGTDVGEAVDGTLTKVQDNTQKASGQFGLMADGFATNSDSMISNFEKIGQTIEDSLVKKVEGLDKLIKELPESVNSSVNEMVEDEKVKAESALQTVQENTARITEIKKDASNSNREISLSEAKIIHDLAKNTTQAYVETLDVSANEKKKILAAMNADVANATEEEAKLWLQSLGKQRQIAQQNATFSRQEKEKYLQELGYNLDGEFAKKFLSAWDEINSTTVKGFDSQMETILKKYPELQNEVSLANGQLIASMGDYADSAIAENEKILKSASDLSRELASNAAKNAEKISWTASESSKAGKKAAQTWNDLVFDEKTGEVKSNVAEVVTEATKDSLTWNNLKLVVHDADLDSNAKDVIGEAAIANGWWDGMAWSDKKAVLQDEFSITMYKALEDSGKWSEMSFDEKKAFLYSNTPEVMAETMLNLGMWEQIQPQIKDLKAENYNLLNALSFSETSLKEYNALDPEVKKLLAVDPATLTVSQSKKMLETYNSISPTLKRLLGNNTNVNSILASSKSKINDYNATGVGAKHLHATANYSEVLRAKSEIAQVYSKNVVIDVEYRGRRTGQTAIPNAKGTNYHPGGDMIVNDQSGPLYKELVQFPGHAPFIPQGRNVYIPNAPVGTKVARASLTKTIMRKLGVPKYADGVGIPEDSSLIRNLKSVDTITSHQTITVDNSDLLPLLQQMLNAISRLTPQINVYPQNWDTKNDIRRTAQELALLTQIEGRGGLG
ncbi:phage tail tape measure protein [Enterococcus casseliflavus]|uniref:phage tail tape measure protein n=2 Tax=Enterococcus casseliflavus TaxID=37734 RepID=UPI003BEEB860